MSYIIIGGGSAGGHGTDAALKDHIDVASGVSDSDAQGDVIIRNATNWTRLAASTSGYCLTTQGAGANPVWAATGAVTDHGALTGLTDDDHTQYLLAAGTRALTADWDAGSFEVRAQTLESDVATGTAPLTIASTTVSTNLNADMLDGVHSTNLILASITYVIDNAGTAITTGVKGFLEIPFACTINRATALADQSGSIVVDIWKDTYANFPPVDGDSITAAAPVTITTATNSQDATLTDWTTAVAAGDILGFNVDSCTTITRCTISLRVVKT